MPRFSEEGNSGGGSVPLSSTFYIDGGTNVLTRTGAIDAPFASLQEAWDTLGFSGTSVVASFLVTPNVDVGPLVIPAGSGAFLSIVGLTSSNRFEGAFCRIGAITADPGADVALGLSNVSTAAGITLPSAASNLEIVDSEIDGNISVGSNFYATNDILSGNITVAQTVHLQLCQFAGGKHITATTIEVDATSNYYAIAQGLTLTGAKVVIADLTP